MTQNWCKQKCLLLSNYRECKLLSKGRTAASRPRKCGWPLLFRCKNVMGNDSPFAIFQHVGQITKLGSGLLGKSAIILGVLLAAGVVAIARLHSDIAIIVTVVLLAIFFFCWFVPIIKFSHEHPAEALLEGSQWAAHQQFLATKGDGVLLLARGDDPATDMKAGKPAPDQLERKI